MDQQRKKQTRTWTKITEEHKDFCVYFVNNTKNNSHLESMLNTQIPTDPPINLKRIEKYLSEVDSIEYLIRYILAAIRKKCSWYIPLRLGPNPPKQVLSTWNFGVEERCYLIVYHLTDVSKDRLIFDFLEEFNTGDHNHTAHSVKKQLATIINDLALVAQLKAQAPRFTWYNRDPQPAARRLDIFPPAATVSKSTNAEKSENNAKVMA